jgi:hypothetical protein
MFYDYNIHKDCNSGALYIRLYCSILMFKEPYKEFAVGRFLYFLDIFPTHRKQTPYRESAGDALSKLENIYN